MLVGSTNSLVSSPPRPSQKNGFRIYRHNSFAEVVSSFQRSQIKHPLSQSKAMSTSSSSLSSSMSSNCSLQRSVRFNDDALTVHCIDCCTDNASDLWFTSDEYKHIKRRNKLCLQLERSGSFQESDSNTFLGLEKQTMLSRLQRRINRSYVLRNNLM